MPTCTVLTQQGHGFTIMYVYLLHGPNAANSNFENLHLMISYTQQIGFIASNFLQE